MLPGGSLHRVDAARAEHLVDHGTDRRESRPLNRGPWRRSGSGHHRDSSAQRRLAPARLSNGLICTTAAPGPTTVSRNTNEQDQCHHRRGDRRTQRALWSPWIGETFLASRPGSILTSVEAPRPRAGMRRPAPDQYANSSRVPGMMTFTTAMSSAGSVSVCLRIWVTPSSRSCSITVSKSAAIVGFEASESSDQAVSAS